MDLILEIFFGACGLMVSFAALFAGAGYFRQGRVNSQLDSNKLFQDRIQAMDEKIEAQGDTIKTQKTDIEKLTEEVKKLHTAVDERDKKINEFISIFQGRDPQMTAFVEIVQKYIQANVPLLQKIENEALPTLERLKIYLDKINPVV